MSLNLITEKYLIDKFSNISNKNDIDTCRTELFAYMKGCPFWTIKATDLRLYRAQKFTSETFCTNVSRLSYPPQEYAKTLGRANRAFAPVLYVGQDGRTAIFESHFKAGDFFAIAEFKIRKGEYLNLQHVGMFRSASETLKSLAGAIPKKLSSDLKLNAIGCRNVKTIHELLGKEFLRDVPEGQESEYFRSVAIAEFLLAYQDADGVIYPSKKSPNDFNIAIKPNSADIKLEIDQVHGFQATEIQDGNVVFRHVAASKSIDASGQIDWSLNEDLSAPSWLKG